MAIYTDFKHINIQVWMQFVFYHCVFNVQARGYSDLLKMNESSPAGFVTTKVTLILARLDTACHIATFLPWIIVYIK